MGETATAIRSLDDVRPGDILLTRISRPRSASILVKLGMLVLGERVRFGRVSVDHALIVTEAAPPGGWPHAVQAMPHGAEEIALTPATHWQPWCVWIRLPEDWPGQADDAAAIALLMVGTPYSFGSYLMLAAYRAGLKAEWLARRINRRRPGVVRLPRWSNGPAAGSDVVRGGRLPVEMICSVLVEQAWTLAGKRVITGTVPQVVTPGMLAVQVWNRAGVIRGGPGILD